MKMLSFRLLAAAAVAAAVDATASLRMGARDAAPMPDVNLRPIIGILSLPNEESAWQGRSYFAASYVKWIESGGARVVPIPYTMPANEVQALLKQINGALFTGGAAEFYDSNGNLTPFAATAKIIFDEAVTAASNGEWWPLHGTCLGHELALTLAAGQKDILSAPFDAENISMALDVTAAAAGSRFLGSAPPDVYSALTTQAVTMNSHQAGITPADFAAYPGAANRFTVLSTNVDRQGKEFISTTQANTMPIYTTQWHPEKPMFEWWATQNVNHTSVSIVANSWTSRFFVSEARKNSRSFNNASAEAAALIYNYQPIYSAAADPGFQQVYLFD